MPTWCTFRDAVRKEYIARGIAPASTEIAAIVPRGAGALLLAQLVERSILIRDVRGSIRERLPILTRGETGTRRSAKPS